MSRGGRWIQRSSQWSQHPFILRRYFFHKPGNQIRYKPLQRIHTPYNLLYPRNHLRMPHLWDQSQRCLPFLQQSQCCSPLQWGLYMQPRCDGLSMKRTRYEFLLLSHNRETRNNNETFCQLTYRHLLTERLIIYFKSHAAAKSLNKSK